MKAKIIAVVKKIIYVLFVWGKPIVKSKIQVELFPIIKNTLIAKGVNPEVTTELLYLTDEWLKKNL
jgi:hypothetical protein